MVRAELGLEAVGGASERRRLAPVTLMKLRRSMVLTTWAKRLGVGSSLCMGTSVFCVS